MNKFWEKFLIPLSICSGRYVDHGLATSSKMALKVTDGSSVSPTAILRIETFPLRIVPEVNSGLEVGNVMGSQVLLTSSNLSFTSNAADQGLPIEYHVIRGPRSGSLQIKRTNGQWTTTDSFNSVELSNQGLRYLLQRPRQAFSPSFSQTTLSRRIRSTQEKGVLSLSETFDPTNFLLCLTLFLFSSHRLLMFLIQLQWRSDGGWVHIPRLPVWC